MGPSVVRKYFIFIYHPTITDKRLYCLLTRIKAGYMQSEGHPDHDGGLAVTINRIRIFSLCNI